MHRRKAVRRCFRNYFYNKQQLRAYFGQVQEEKFRNFFRKYVANGTLRNSSFFTVLERRVDVFFFRARLLPTIFACHQYILHQGVLINDGKKHSPSILVRPGDTLTISVEH
jgi:small subunit ribosomal protein S4